MKGLKMSKQLRYMFIAFILVIICSSTYSKGTSTSLDSGGGAVTSNLPYIEMKVKSSKVGETTQVKVECWASNFSYLEGIETVFTYDSTKLTPSYISGDNQNEALTGLESIKYDKRPQSTSAQEAFDNASKSLLKNSFEFESSYTDVLEIDVFRFLATEGNNEALQFVVTKKDYLTDVSATEPILLGTFSFRQTENTIIEENEFTTKRIKIICDDGLTPGDLSAYIREEANGEDCTEIIEFAYEKYGSISGTIETGYYNGDTFEKIGNNIVTIKLYNADDVSGIDWNIVGESYRTNRFEIQPILEGNYKLWNRPDSSKNPNIQPVMELTTKAEDLGTFKLDKILFGEYVVVIDKLNYADYIITNIVVDSINKDIDLGNKQLQAGDLNKDGKIDKTDRTVFLQLYSGANKIQEELGFVAFDLNDDENQNKNSEKTDRTYMLRILSSSLNKTIKKVECYM